ncbi:MAG: hypothetical protein LBI56_04515 [Puniceicoccales bacterium]|nr:hypothetical protein [Puniceicoccales bacterium]
MDQGLVYLISPGSDPNEEWEKLVATTDNSGRRLEGVTRDPRLLEIAKMVLDSRSLGLKPGAVYQPLVKRKITYNNESVKAAKAALSGKSAVSKLGMVFHFSNKQK